MCVPRRTGARSAGLFRNPGVPDRDLRAGDADVCHGRNLHVDSRVSAAVCRADHGEASTLVGAITVVDGIAGTAVGGWIAQRWLRTNHRALYLLSFWSVALTLPCGALVFFGPAKWTVPALFAAEFFLFLNTGPLNAAIVNSVSAPVRATAISVNLFCIHFFGDTFSPQIIGAVATARKPAAGAGGDAGLAGGFGVILLAGARFAPLLDDGQRGAESPA